MAEQFVDRKSTYPNRFKITRADGSSEFVTLERADDPTVAGTPLNAETFNKIVEELNKAFGESGGTMTGELIISKKDPYIFLENTESGNRIGLHYYGSTNGNNAFGIYDEVMGRHIFTIDQASGCIALLPHQYGDNLPDPGVPGRIFFKKVSG